MSNPYRNDPTNVYRFHHDNDPTNVYRFHHDYDDNPNRFEQDIFNAMAADPAITSYTTWKAYAVALVYIVNIEPLWDGPLDTTDGAPWYVDDTVEALTRIDKVVSRFFQPVKTLRKRFEASLAK